MVKRARPLARVRMCLLSVHLAVHYSMPRRYSIAEARSHLPTLVDQAEAGQAVELTRRGKPVAVLLSLTEVARLRAERVSFGDAYHDFLAQHSLADFGIEPEVFVRARDRTLGRAVGL